MNSGSAAGFSRSAGIDGDVQLQFFTLRVVAILPHAVLAAASRDAAAGQRALQAAVG